MLSAVRSTVERYHILTYVALTFALSWGLFGLLYVLPASAGIGRSLAVIGGAYGPLLAAMALLVVRDRSVLAWAKTVFSVRVRLRLYIIALAIPLLGIAAAGGVHAYAFGGTLTLNELPPLIEFPLFLLVVFFLGGGQEEPGWRGYLLPLLETRVSPLVSATAIGLLWALWHLPLFGAPGTVQSEISFLLYVAYVIALSVILTWLANRSEWSVLPAMVFHAAANGVVNYYPTGGELGATSGTAQGLLTVTASVLAVGIVVLSGPKLGFESVEGAMESSVFSSG